MREPPLFSSASTSFVLSLVVMVASPVDRAFAQSGHEAGSNFGDRQTGHFGDPGAGHFGNPAAGEFDKYNLREPAPGTQAAGKVYKKGGAPESSPYISLPTPKDAAVTAEPAKPAAPSKKRKTAKR